MRDDKKQDKHKAIATAAYALLADKGYAGASMLSIAKAAKASNETPANGRGSDPAAGLESDCDSPDWEVVCASGVSKDA